MFDKRSDGLAQHRLLSKGSLLGCSLALKLERTAPAAVDHHPVELSTFVFRRSCDESFVALTGGVPVPAPPVSFYPVYTSLLVGRSVPNRRTPTDNKKS